MEKLELPPIQSYVPETNLLRLLDTSCIEGSEAWVDEKEKEAIEDRNPLYARHFHHIASQNGNLGIKNKCKNLPARGSASYETLRKEVDVSRTRLLLYACEENLVTYNNHYPSKSEFRATLPSDRPPLIFGEEQLSKSNALECLEICGTNKQFLQTLIEVCHNTLNCASAEDTRVANLRLLAWTMEKRDYLVTPNNQVLPPTPESVADNGTRTGELQNGTPSIRTLG